MAINISAIQLADTELVNNIAQTLEKYQVPPNKLVLELTETALLDIDDVNRQHLFQLSEMGCKLALDDFGTGFSSLSHLLNFPIDTVKLDKSLLPTSDKESRHLSIFNGISAMANIIGLHTVAEGIETKYQADLCQSLQVSDLQGYFFCKPINAKELEVAWFEA